MLAYEFVVFFIHWHPFCVYIIAIIACELSRLFDAQQKGCVCVCVHVCMYVYNLLGSLAKSRVGLRVICTHFCCDLTRTRACAPHPPRVYISDQRRLHLMCSGGTRVAALRTILQHRSSPIVGRRQIDGSEMLSRSRSRM